MHISHQLANTQLTSDAVVTIAEDECVIQLGKKKGNYSLIEFGETNITCGSTAQTIGINGKFNYSWDLIIYRLIGKLVFKPTIKHQTDYGYFSETITKSTWLWQLEVWTLPSAPFYRVGLSRK